MRVVLFYHSLRSDWNHGNAHFLRGVVTELQYRGHDVEVYEPANAWSVENLVREQGAEPLNEFKRRFPYLRSRAYEADRLDLDEALNEADLVLVHEWNEPALVQQIGKHHLANPDYVLFFHDTHHRSVTAPEQMGEYDLSNYDGVLAFGRAVRDVYLKQGWASRAFTWHEAADTRVFTPRKSQASVDLVWIGNWGDDERTGELEEFLIEPVRRLGLRACVYGVRYPQAAREALDAAGIRYGGWVPNFRVPEIFSRSLLTVHVPRRVYADVLPGIPTIRVFEALACGMPLVSSPWEDSEQLFTPGYDYRVARDGDEMTGELQRLLQDPEERRALGERGRSTVLRRHTCAHRVEELLEFYWRLKVAHGRASASSVGPGSPVPSERGST